MLNTTWIPFLLLVCCGTLLTSGLSLAGPYEIEILNVGQCDHEFNNQMNFEVEKHRKDKSDMIYTINFDWPHEDIENVTMSFNASKWTSGGWGKHAYDLDFDPYCSEFLKKFPSLFKVIAESIGHPEECPFRSASYVIPELPTKFKLDEFPALPYGKYLTDFNYFLNGELFGCIQFTLEVLELPA